MYVCTCVGIYFVFFFFLFPSSIRRRRAADERPPLAGDDDDVKGLPLVAVCAAVYPRLKLPLPFPSRVPPSTRSPRVLLVRRRRRRRGKWKNFFCLHFFFPFSDFLALSAASYSRPTFTLFAVRRGLVSQ